MTEASITPKAPDPKNAVTVDGGKPGSPLPLNTGLSEIKIEVTSPDGTNKKVHVINIHIISTSLNMLKTHKS